MITESGKSDGRVESPEEMKTGTEQATSDHRETELRRTTARKRLFFLALTPRETQPKTATWTYSSLRPPRSGFSKEWPASGVSFGTCGMALPYLQ